MRALSLAILFATLASCSTTTPVDPAPVAATAEELPEMPQPTPEHDAIVATAGRWVGTLTSFEAGPDPITAEAVEIRTPVGGFWIHSVLRMDFMGMPFHGEESIGFDPTTGTYQGSWIDSSNSYRALTTGERQADGQTIRWRWVAPDWQTGEMVDHWRDERFDDDTYRSTFYRRGPDGPPVRIMIVEMRRDPAAPAGSL